MKPCKDCKYCMDCRYVPALASCKEDEWKYFTEDEE